MEKYSQKLNLAQKEQSYMHELVVTLVVCPRGGGKTTLAQLLHKLFGIDAVVYSDTSSILDLHMKKKTEIGLKLIEMQKHRESGRLFPCDLVCRATFQWIKALRETKNIAHVIMAGSPRSEEQARKWLIFTKKLRVIHIQADREHVLTGIRSRQIQTGIVRPDESEEAINTAWNEYEQKILPGLKILNENVLNLNRDQSMRFRLEETIKHIVVHEPLRQRLLSKLNDRRHPVSKRVDELDAHHIAVAKASLEKVRKEVRKDYILSFAI